MRSTSVCVLALGLVMGVATGLQGETLIPIDDFEDGNLDGWTLLDFSKGHPWGPGLFDVSGGELRMAHNGPDPVPPGTLATQDVLLAAWNASAADQLYSTGFVRSQVRVDEEGSVPSMHMRLDLGTFSSYFMYPATPPASPPAFRLSKLFGGGETVLWESPFEVQVGEQWNMELGVVGNTISAKAWQVGTTEPTAPQFSTVDPAVLGPGQIALTNDIPTALVFAARADASFDNVSFVVVPEPATCVLLLAGLLTAFPWKRIR